MDKFTIKANPASDPYTARGFTHRKVYESGGFLYLHKNKLEEAKAQLAKMAVAESAAMACANPNMSLREIEKALGHKPVNYASAFKKGTKQHEAEQRDYESRAAEWQSKRKG
jgi:hypothetical protein